MPLLLKLRRSDLQQNPPVCSLIGRPDTAVNTVTVRPLSVAPTDSRTVAIRVQQLEEEIRRLNGLVEEQASLLARLQDQTLERYVEMDRRLAALGLLRILCRWSLQVKVLSSLTRKM